MMETRYLLDSYDYELPPERIAQAPVADRAGSRLLVVHRNRADGFEHRTFCDLARYLKPGDLLVLNDTRVVPSRLRGHKDSGGAIDLLVLDPYQTRDAARSTGYQCLIKASKAPRRGSRLTLTGGVQAMVEDTGDGGRFRVRFEDERPLANILEEIGEVPLPPYIARNGAPSPVDDRTTYQTVYADRPGAVAAPTAGLHFTADLLRRLADRGVVCVRITLHVGYGTFAPIRARDIRDHRMHAEQVEVSREAAQTLAAARKDRRRIIAVGSTAVRTLEWVALRTDAIAAYSGPCDHFIYPGYRFRIVDAMITNFHLPKSTLIVLVSAFAGRETILAAYREAIGRNYRFYSYGDAMLLV